MCCHDDMEITQTDLRISDFTAEFSSSPCIDDKNEDPVWIVRDSLIDNIQINHNINEIKDHSLQSSHSNENSFYSETLDDLEPNLNSIQHETSTSSNDIIVGPVYIDSLDGEQLKQLNERSCRLVNRTTEIFIKNEEKKIYNISTIVIPSDILELSLNIKKETDNFNSDWSIEENRENSCEEYSKVDEKICEKDANNVTKLNVKKKYEISKHRISSHQRLRKKAKCMREKRKKLCECESIGERLDRLSKEAAKRREIRMYYETPEKRRKRLDNEAARKRDYRMYNETPEDRRKRLDREAERRRFKRLSMYANETPDERRERLNRESSKRRESRLNQYAKETEKERQSRLEKDATRAREMRFTRSAIESDEERRERLVKDALRKRELRMRSGDDRMRNLTELQTVRNFEDSNDTEIKLQQQDNQFGSHYISNWMMWVHSTVNQSENNADVSHRTQTDA